MTPVEAGSTELLRLRVTAGMDASIDRDLPERTQRVVQVARLVGAPLVEALDAGLAAERDLRASTRAVQVASAQTRVVAGGLLAAPFVLVPVLGRVLGADLVGFYRSPVGLVVLAVGTGLLLAGAGIIWLLVRRVARPSASRPAVSLPAFAIVAPAVIWVAVGPTVALVIAVGIIASARRRGTTVLSGTDEVAELVAVAVAGGTTIGEALRIAADHVEGHAVPLRRLAFDLDHGIAQHTDPDPAGELQRLTDVLVAAQDLGAPVGPALRRLAAELRADELARVLAAAERLPAQLTFPTALCLLPATLLLVGAPIIQAGLATVGT